MMEWQPIETAPRDGTEIKYRRVMDGDVLFEGRAVWRTVRFPALPPHPLDGLTAGGEAYEATGWMMPDREKRVPEPTHWMPK